MTNHPPLPLQFLDGPGNPYPHPPAVEVALFRELDGAHGGFDGAAAAICPSARRCALALRDHR